MIMWITKFKMRYMQGHRNYKSTCLWVEYFGRGFCNIGECLNSACCVNCRNAEHGFQHIDGMCCLLPLSPFPNAWTASGIDLCHFPGTIYKQVHWGEKVIVAWNATIWHIGGKKGVGCNLPWIIQYTAEKDKIT